MTAYCEGSIISRELHDMLATELATERFERELEVLHSQRDGNYPDSVNYREWLNGTLKTAEVI